MLRVASDLRLPPDAVTQAIGVLAKRRAGKSYTARRLAEQLFRAGQQLVIVDPKGDWWGIRSAADGKSPGLPIVILGGERGDVPLEAGSGEIVAKLVTEQRVSVLLDLSLFRKHEVATFMTSFLENLYRLKAREIYRTPLMLIIDEADAIAPQKPQENEARMLGAAEDIVRRGGQRGIGCMLITQRSAVLNKNVLTQVEVLVALRTIAPQDLKAMDAWIEVHGEKEQRDTLMSSLPSLPVGDAWFWSPGWPTKDGIFQRVHVLPIETFDSGATPKSGEKRVEPKNLADVDLESLTQQMAATIERAKADDPRELRKKIAELEKEIRTFRNSKPAAAVVDQGAIERAVNAALANVYTQIRSEALHIRKSLAKINSAAHEIVEMIDAPIARLDVAFIEAKGLPGDAKPATLLASKEHGRNPASPAASQSGSRPERRPVGHAGRDSRERPATTLEGVSRPQLRMLRALASFEALGVNELAKSHVGVFSNQSPTSSGLDKNFSTLRAAGLIEYLEGSRVRLTAAGREAAGPAETPASLRDLHGAWYAKISGPQRRMLEVLIDAYPEELDKDELAQGTDQSPTSSGFDKNCSTLRSLGLVDYAPGKRIHATQLLFPEGLA